MVVRNRESGARAVFLPEGSKSEPRPGLSADPCYLELLRMCGNYKTLRLGDQKKPTATEHVGWVPCALTDSFYEE